MNELADICRMNGAALSSASRDTLVDCVNVVQALNVPGIEIGLIVAFLVIGALVGIGVRHRAGKSVPAIVGGAFETGLYGAVGAYGGSFAGLLYAELAGPTAMGIALVAFGIIALAGIVLGFMYGDGSAGQKVGGVIFCLLWSGLFVGGAILAFGVENADSHAAFLNYTAVTFGVVAGLNGLLVGVFRAMHPALGWLIIPVVSTWGLVGTVIGVMMHFGSWFFYEGWGKQDSSYDYNGLGMVVYENGFRVKQNYAFTGGGVVNADTSQMVWHEAIHVLQHILFGSIYPISYVLWAALLGLAGMIAGPIKANFSQGVFALAYLNNPWEVWEYRSSWNGSTSNPRQSYGMYSDGTAMVWGDGLALGVGIPYIIVMLVLWVLWMILRLT